MENTKIAKELPTLPTMEDLVAHWHSKGDKLNPPKLLGQGEIFVKTSPIVGRRTRFRIVHQTWTDSFHKECPLNNSDIWTYFNRNHDFPNFPKVTGIWKWTGEVWQSEMMMLGREPGMTESFCSYIGGWELISAGVDAVFTGET